MNLKLNEKVHQFFLNNPVLKVFTQEYKKETKYHECMKKNVNIFKLESSNYDISEDIKILEKMNFKNNYKISVKDE